MPEFVSESPLDRLHWLLSGKLTASEVEELGAIFAPQFHFMALLPAPGLPASEAAKVQSYFDAMFEALVPVRDSIAAYWLRGVMSRTPVSDFSLEVQFSDPYVVDMVRRSLPRELSGCAVSTQRRHETTSTTQAEAPMFFRDKSRQESPDQAIGNVLAAPAAAARAPAQAAAPAPESAAPEPAPRVVAIAMPAPAAVLPEPVYTPPVAAPTPAPEPEPKLKKMVVAEGITINGGDILGCAHLAIEGEAYSTIDRCEKLEILANGIFKGSASVGDALISGYCTGTLVVSGTLRITRTGHFVGSVQYGRLQVEDGGVIEGEMKMPLKGSDTARPTSSENPRWLEVSAKLSA